MSDFAITTEQDATDKFREILGQKESWKPFGDTLFVEHLATFMSWALRRAQFAANRAVAETSRSAALNRSSVIAKAQDVGYIPVKAIPSSGMADVKNNGSANVSIPARLPLVSDDGIYYATDGAAVAAPGGVASVKIKQVKIEDIFFAVSAEKKFHTVLFGREVSEKLSSFSVYVDETMSGSYTEWSYAQGFRNVAADAKVYDEFYSHTDENGVRFGNGVFGKILPAGAMIKVSACLSEGETFLLAGQELSVVGSLTDSAGAAADVEISAKENISGGSPREGTEEIRAGVGYWPVYNEKLVWAEDYIFFLKRRFPGMLWGAAWGEQEQEAEAGSASLDYINRIWITGYCPSVSDFSTQAIAALNDNAGQLNKTFVWKAPAHVTFNVAVSGKVSPGHDISGIEQRLTEIFTEYYGKDSARRRDVVNLNDMYMAANADGFFDVPEKAHVSISLTGTTAPGKLNEMVSMGSLTFDIGYL